MTSRTPTSLDPMPSNADLLRMKAEREARLNSDGAMTIGQLVEAPQPSCSPATRAYGARRAGRAPRVG
jgi:hypothetical protein